ncbi:MAG: hypothetical protein PHY54_20675 [Methylococcales bacterium]|nr:hypothetical protein [Methylococcales bacterium]
MAKNSTWKATRNAGKATRNLTSKATNVAEKAITGLGRWAVTDHTGAAKLLANLPPMGWVDNLSVILVTALCGFLGALASAAMVLLLLAYGLPLLFTL